MRKAVRANRKFYDIAHGIRLAYLLKALTRLMRSMTSAGCQPTAEGWLNRGAALCNESKYDEAIVAYDEVIRLNPKDAYVWHNKGYVLYAMGRYDEAIMLMTRQSG
jgi:tetratricopeptide (TPR) repeat protein